MPAAYPGTPPAWKVATPYPGTVPDQRRTLREPLDPPMVPFALAGIALWAVAGLVLLAADGPAEWLRICLAGLLLGIPGLVVMLVHDRRRARRRAGRDAAQP